MEDRGLELSKKYKTLLNKYNVNTPLRLAHFFAQLKHESNLKPISENLNYSQERLLQIFPKYFNSITAKQYARKPQAIANRVYANRMGNGDEASGDGWKFRGKGFIQITGLNNYKQLSQDTKVDYINNPDLLLNEADSMISALWYWNKIKANSLADNNNIEAITKAINGGYNGLEDRKINLQYYKSIFK